MVKAKGKTVLKQNKTKNLSDLKAMNERKETVFIAPGSHDYCGASHQYVDRKKIIGISSLKFLPTASPRSPWGDSDSI